MFHYPNINPINITHILLYYTISYYIISLGFPVLGCFDFRHVSFKEEAISSEVKYFGWGYYGTQYRVRLDPPLGV